MATKEVGLFKALWKTTLDANTSDQREERGMQRWVWDSDYGLKGYIYGQAASATTVADGTVLTFVSGHPGSDFTSDISTSSVNYVAGVGRGAITADYWGWIQNYGYHSVIKTDGGQDIAAADALIVDPTVDGTCDSVAAATAPTHRTLGFAVAADVDANNTVAGFLRCV